MESLYTGVELESVAPGYCDHSNSTGVELEYLSILLQDNTRIILHDVPFHPA